MELFSPKIKKVLIFSQKKLFLYFGTRVFFLKKTCYILGANFTSSKNKKNLLRKNFLYFGKWNFLAPKYLKAFLYP